MENKLLHTVKENLKEEKFAIGNDLVSLSEFAASFNELFKKKVYTQAEQTYCDAFSDPVLRYASTWAAKEAVYKAIKQINSQTLGWKKLEILRNGYGGKPEVTVHLENTYRISLSISHDGDYVWAVALVKI